MQLFFTTQIVDHFMFTIFACAFAIFVLTLKFSTVMNRSTHTQTLDSITLDDSITPVTAFGWSRS